MTEDKRFAVLIDSDNVSDKYIKPLLDELSNDGSITYKRIYGDWTRPDLKSWKSVLLPYSITPIRQYGYTTGKNSTDSAMIIDAMDILYTGNVDGFCLVSSDSDFTRLASRLRESGMFVVGMGEKKTPAPFIAACTKFKFLEVLAQSNLSDETPQAGPDEAAEEPQAAPLSAATPLEAVITPLETIKKAIDSIVEETSDDDGWSSLSDIGNILIKRFPDFDVRNYGSPKLTRFVRSLGSFDIRPMSVKNSSTKLIYIRRKEQKEPKPAKADKQR